MVFTVSILLFIICTVYKQSGFLIFFKRIPKRTFSLTYMSDLKYGFESIFDEHALSKINLYLSFSESNRTLHKMQVPAKNALNPFFKNTPIIPSAINRTDMAIPVIFNILSDFNLSEQTDNIILPPSKGKIGSRLKSASPILILQTGYVKPYEEGYTHHNAAINGHRRIFDNGPAEATVNASESDSPQSKARVAPKGETENLSGLKPSLYATIKCENSCTDKTNNADRSKISL